MVFLIEEMHRASEATRTAGCLSEEFSHARVRTRATGKRVRVIAIRGDEVIIRSRRRNRATDDGFLADVEMAKSTDLLRLVLLAGALLETPNQQHQREHFDFVTLLRELHAGLGSVREDGSRADAFRTANEVHAKKEQSGKNKVTYDRVAKKHPGRRRAELWQTDSERLNQPGKGLGVTGIAQPRKRVRDDVEKNRADE
jgi:hypothetical protein